MMRRRPSSPNGVLLEVEANELCDHVRRRCPDVRILFAGVQQLPLILEIEHFLAPDQVAHLLQLGQRLDLAGQFSPSTVEDDDAVVAVRTTVRTSDSALLPHRDPCVRDIASRVAALLQVEPDQVSRAWHRPWLLRYAPVREQTAEPLGVVRHSDFVPSLRRIYTCLIYLSHHGDSDGQTVFYPRPDDDALTLTVKPRPGKLVVFRVASRDGRLRDDYADHAALGVTAAGTAKLVCQFFVRAAGTAWL